jgi:hypothetical protein
MKVPVNYRAVYDGNISELSRLKHFNPLENKATLLLAEVKKYIGQIQNKYLAGRKEVEYMQPEIRDNFWPNT